MKLQGNVLKRSSMRLAAALLAVLASFVAGPSAALAAASGREPDREGRQRRAGGGEMRSRHMLKRTSMRFSAALLAALAGFVGGPNAALAAAPQHHDQAPGFYRLKVGDLEVTALSMVPAYSIRTG